VHLALAGFEQDWIRADFLRRYSIDRLPNDATLRQRAVEFLRKQGKEDLAQAKLQDALDAYQQSLKIRQTLAEQDKSNADWQRNLWMSYIEVGDVLLTQGKLVEAMDAYQQSFKLRQILAGQETSNSSLQRDLEVSYEKIGDILVLEGKPQEALIAYQKDLQTAERLAERDTSNTSWQQDLIVSLYKLGKTTAKIGGKDNVTRGEEILRKALDVADKYSGSDKQQLIDALNQALQQLAH
jgi:tetratricopeptide (TPR) repeat protein